MQFVTREEWGAAAPHAAYSPLTTLLGMAVHYEGSPAPAPGHEHCAPAVKSVQTFHQGPSRGWNDIAYSWLVCLHGIVFEARGWGHRTAAQGTTEGNGHYHAVCALGETPHDFTPEQQHGLLTVIDEGRRLGYGGEVRSHSSFHGTDCPGPVIRGWVLAGVPYATAPERSPEVEPVGHHRTTSHPGYPPFSGHPLVVRTAGSAVTAWQRQMAHRGWTIVVDGLYGPASSKVCREFQTEKGLTASGQVDRATWEAAFTAPITGSRHRVSNVHAMTAGKSA